MIVPKVMEKTGLNVPLKQIGLSNETIHSAEAAVGGAAGAITGATVGKDLFNLAAYPINKINKTANGENTFDVGKIIS
jgi:hypothetical protein